MKDFKNLLLSAALAGTMGLAYNASAQYKPADEDGIAASPKVRQMLNERKVKTAGAKTGAITVAATVRSGAENDGIAASPKVRQMMGERRAPTSSPVSGSEYATVGYVATGPDGITASPKVRQQLNERTTVLTVAPVK